MSKSKNHTPSVNLWVYRTLLLIARIVTFGIRLDVRGLSNVPPKDTPLVVAANHEMWIDPAMIALALPDKTLQFMAKKEAFVPIVKCVMESAGSFPVNRQGKDISAVRNAIRILNNKGTLGIFPQGSRRGESFHGGVAMIAAKGKAPILPVGIRYTSRRCIVSFGELIDPSGGIEATTEKIERVLSELSMKPDSNTSK